MSVSRLTNAAFDKNNMFSKCDPKNGKYMAVCMMYRGEIAATDVQAAIAAAKNKKTLSFVDWSPTGFSAVSTAAPCCCSWRRQRKGQPRSVHACQHHGHR